MMKLLFKPTGNIFTLPDEEALKIKAKDRGNYEILDCGLNKEEKPQSVSQKQVKEIEQAKSKARAKELAELENLEEKAPVKKENTRLKKFDIAEDYSNLTKKELAIIVRKVTGKGVDPNWIKKAWHCTSRVTICRAHIILRVFQDYSTKLYGIRVKT